MLLHRLRPQVASYKKKYILLSLVALWPHAYHVEILTRNSNGDVQTGMIPLTVSNGAVQTGTNPFIANTGEIGESTPYFSDSGSQHDERDTNPILENMEAGRRQH